MTKWVWLKQNYNQARSKEIRGTSLSIGGDKKPDYLYLWSGREDPGN